MEHLPEVQLLGATAALNLSDIFREAWNKSIRRDFFWTERNYVGSAARCVREGDVVVLLPEVRAPMILRPSSGVRYQVVRRAYVHGLMYVSEKDWKDMDLTDISLE